MPTRRRALLILAVLAGLAILSLALALAVGSVAVPLPAVFAALFGGEGGGTYTDIILNLRLPRALAGFACGGLLALAGALLQVLLRNPLADPYVLGISGGASIGALTAILFGFAALGVHGAAFVGALAAMLVVFGLAHGDGSWTQTRLLLTGVIVAAGCGALVALLLHEVAAAPELPLHVPLPQETRLAALCTAFMQAPDIHRTAQDWSVQLHMSLRTFGRHFLEQTGMPFQQWRQRACVAHALSRLAQGDAVTTIAMDMGYDSPGAFSTMFTRIVGKPPSALRADLAV